MRRIHEGSIVTLRKQGTDLKQIAIPALRHFMRDDREIQVRLDTIASGSGELDLSDDLIKLADLVEANMAALKTPEISKSMPALMRGVGGKISDAISERTSDVDSSRSCATGRIGISSTWSRRSSRRNRGSDSAISGS